MYDKDFFKKYCSILNSDIVLLKTAISNILDICMTFHMLNTFFYAGSQICAGSLYPYYLDLEQPKVCPGFQENCHYSF